MNIVYRRIIISVFSIFFLIAAPLVVTYTAGYRLSLKDFKFIATGNLYFEGKDISNASITLNGELTDEQFTKKHYINNILPGTYTIEIQKEGYYTWTKKVEVKEHLTTFIQDIVLFARATPQTITSSEEKVTLLGVTSDFSLVARASQEITDYLLISHDDHKETLLYRASQNLLATISLSPKNKLVLFTTPTLSFVVDVKSAQVTTLPTGLEWQWNSTEDELVSFTTKEVLIFNFKTATAEVVYTSTLPLLDVLAYNNTLYVMSQDAQSTLVSSFQRTLKSTTTIATLASSTHLDLHQITPDVLIIKNNSARTFHVISLTEKTDALSSTIHTLYADTLILSPNNNMLALTRGNEVTVFNIATSTTHFIERFSINTNNLYWFDNAHLIIQKDKEILAFDLRTHNNLTQTTLYNTQSSLNHLFVMDGQLFFEEDSSIKVLNIIL